MRIHANPVSTALMHPTRRALYLALLGADEHTTVQLQKIVNVDRYNLYHHLQKLADLGLIINHRDEGRARWWCVLQRVSVKKIKKICVRNFQTTTNLSPLNCSYITQIYLDE